MGFFKTVKKGLTMGWKPTQWVGAERLKQDGALIKGLASSLFQGKRGAEASALSFEACLEQYGLTEATLKKRMRDAKTVSIFCSVLGAGVLLYGVYLMTCGLWLSVFLCVVLALVGFSHAVQESFNLFRMQQRRLDCTVKDWLMSFFARAKP